MIPLFSKKSKASCLDDSSLTSDRVSLQMVILNREIFLPIKHVIPLVLEVLVDVMELVGLGFEIIACCQFVTDQNIHKNDQAFFGSSLYGLVTSS